MVEVYNKCDRLTAIERERLQTMNPEAVCIAALTKEGLDELIEIIASRLALDVVRVTLTLDPTDPTTASRIAQLYRHARVTLHEVRDDTVSIAAAVPRRLLSRIDPSQR